MNPEAYITATRQCVAQANSWSLEELHLKVSIEYNYNISNTKWISHNIFHSHFQVTIPDPGQNVDPVKLMTEIDGSSFCVVGLKLQGAQVRNNQLLLTSTIMLDLPATIITWIR